MGSEQSSLPAGAPGSRLRSQRDEEIPYTQYSISKPIDSHSPRQSPRPQKQPRQPVKQDKDGTPKHEIVVVADGNVLLKDPDPELTKLNTIPVFFPVIRGSLNIPVSSRDTELLDKLDSKVVLQLCARHQEHLRQLSEAVAFDQNALCIRIKEIDHTVNVLMSTLTERQKKYSKYVEQFGRLPETVQALRKIQHSMNEVLPTMDRLNQMLPGAEQLEPFHFPVKEPKEH